MRQYLHLVWILGSVVACSGSSSGGAADSGDMQPTAGSDSALPAAGSATTPGGAPSGGVTSGGANNSSAGSKTTAGGNQSAVGASIGGAPNGGSNGGATNGGATSGGGTGTSGAGTAGGTGKQPPSFKFPTSVGPDQKLTKTMTVTDFDGKLTRYIGSGDLGGSDQAEGQDPLFLVKAGGSLKNVILGAPAADGVHCEGSCTIDNVWWEDVGEDAITLQGKDSSIVYRISNSGARKATDKVIQHNGAGTLYVKNFYVEDFGKLYRSCGNCGTQYQRHSEFDTVVANGSKSVLAGVNTTYKDSAKFANIFPDLTMKVCETYEGNSTGAEPKLLGSGADGTYCIYSPSDIVVH